MTGLESVVVRGSIVFVVIYIVLELSRPWMIKLFDKSASKSVSGHQRLIRFELGTVPAKKRLETKAEAVQNEAQ